MKRVDALQVALARELCGDLALVDGVVYVAVERRGGPTIGEAGDRKCFLNGPIKSALQEELATIEGGLLLRVVYDNGADRDRLQTSVQSAKDRIRQMLHRSAGGRPGMAPPQSGGAAPSGISGAAPAQVGVHDGARKRWLS
jgi:hypothetical protein